MKYNAAQFGFEFLALKPEEMKGYRKAAVEVEAPFVSVRDEQTTSYASQVMRGLQDRAVKPAEVAEVVGVLSADWADWGRKVVARVFSGTLVYGLGWSRKVEGGAL